MKGKERLSNPISNLTKPSARDRAKLLRKLPDRHTPKQNKTKRNARAGLTHHEHRSRHAPRLTRVHTFHHCVASTGSRT